MRFLLALALLATVYAPAHGQVGSGNAAGQPRAAKMASNQVQLSNGRYWFQTARGQWLIWEQGRWQTATPPVAAARQAPAAPPAQMAQRRAAQPYMVYRYSYPAANRYYFFDSDDSARPAPGSAMWRTANGHWYLNGRGYFSD